MSPLTPEWSANRKLSRNGLLGSPGLVEGSIQQSARGRAVVDAIGEKIEGPDIVVDVDPVFATGDVTKPVTRLAPGKIAGRLLLKHQRRPADSLPLEVDSHLDTVGDLDEGNALIHPVVLRANSTPRIAVRSRQIWI